MAKKKKDGLFSLLDLEMDRWIFKKLRIVMTHAEKIWLLDSDGDYQIYHKRLRLLAHDYGLGLDKWSEDESKRG